MATIDTAAMAIGQPRTSHAFRVSADSSQVTIDDYYRGITLYQHPWAPEVGEPDSQIHFSEVDGGEGVADTCLLVRHAGSFLDVGEATPLTAFQGGRIINPASPQDPDRLVRHRARPFL